ncbi:MAG TPA: DNA-binding protein [Mycobacteriales bacterium]|nr:DNA-binding protein [Mycobacteriales bacterium]
MATVGDVLTRAGVAVSESEFARLVAAALRDLGPAPADDPAAALSAPEREALAAVGADLQRRGRREADPRAAAAAGVAAVLADAVPVAAAAQRLGVDASRVRHRLADHQLFGVRRSDGWRLPSWQFGPDGLPLPGLERVLRALPADVHPVVATRFFLTPQPELVLGRTALSPRQWLAGGGDPAAVVALAAGLAVLL